MQQTQMPSYKKVLMNIEKVEHKKSGALAEPIL
jgi:hypothetical protein